MSEISLQELVWKAKLWKRFSMGKHWEFEVRTMTMIENKRFIKSAVFSNWPMALSLTMYKALPRALLFLVFYFTILYWFCHTSTWIRHGCTRVPNPEPPLPPSSPYHLSASLKILFQVCKMILRYYTDTFTCRWFGVTTSWSPFKSIHQIFS